MPSLRQKVTTYFRQLSFIGDSRDGARHSGVLSPRKVDDGTFITKYLEGRMDSVFSPGPDIHHGKEPNELPDLEVACYPSGSHTVTAACTGPDEGLTAVRRSKLHLSAGSDIDFIDTNYDQELEVRKSTTSQQKHKFSNAKYRSDQNANKTPSTRQRKNSRTGELPADKPDSKNEKQTSINVVVSMVSKRQISIDTSDGTKAETQTITDQLDLLESVKVNDNFGMDSTLSNAAQMQQNLSDLCFNRNDVENEANTSPSITNPPTEPIAGVDNWKTETEHAYGISVSLYENNFLTKEPMGNPIADCYGLVVRGNSCAMALADGVNWGEGARLAGRSAVQGCLEYLNTAIFGMAQSTAANSTRDVFVSLLRSLWEGHACILETGGALSTLTVVVVLPLGEEHLGKYVVCSCNVGDSLGYVYSKKHGVREFTQGSHDISSMRDMRDALGAIGPVDGNKPELSNLTLSMTIVESGDIVFLTSDGISDNFDPVVGKFAEAFSTEKKQIEPQLAPKRQNKSTSALHPRTTKEEKQEKRYSVHNQPVSHASGSSSSSSTSNQPPQRPPRVKKSISVSHSQKSASGIEASARPKYLRSHTVIEPRTSHKSTLKFSRSAAGLPIVSAYQRHALTLLRLEDLLSYGINGTLRPCPSARKLCHLLVDFVKMITAARRKMLEQRELFYKIVTDPATGIRREVELTRVQHRAARKRIVESTLFSSLPGKLDHATVVAFTVGSGLQTTEFNETNF